MKLFSKILMGFCISLVMLIGYYLFPIPNKNNIADPALKSDMTYSTSYRHWQEYHSLLSHGHCAEALRKYASRSTYDQDIYWFTRMLRLGVCVPKDPEHAYEILETETRHNYFPVLFHLGYLTEMGIGAKADPEYARSLYRHAFSQAETLNEAHYKWIITEFRYLFDGQVGTPLLRRTFEELLAER